jgi:hypothetical protein
MTREAGDASVFGPVFEVFGGNFPGNEGQRIVTARAELQDFSPMTLPDVKRDASIIRIIEG